METSIDRRLFSELEDLGRLFEDSEEQEQFLMEITLRIKDHLRITMAAIFVFDPDGKELVFRAGADDTGVWNAERCGDGEGHGRFSLDDDSAAGRAFRRSRVVRYDVTPHERHRMGAQVRTKLLVPLARGPQRFGVLVLGDERPDAFKDLSDGTILELASKIGDTLQDASVLVHHRRRSATVPHRIRGRRASHGIAVGAAVVFWTSIEELEEDYEASGDPSTEEEAFDAALERSLHQLSHLEDSDSSGLAEMSSLIFGAHRLMLRDHSFTERIREHIRDGHGAVTAIRTVVEAYAKRFAAMRETRLAEKAHDVRDLGYRLITNLHGGDDDAFSWSGRIALARHVFPSDLARLAVEGVSGIVLMGGAVTAHISILASSLDVPVLITDDDALLSVADGTVLVLDADGEQLLVNPDREERERWEHRIARFQAGPTAFHLRGRTSDGAHIQVTANVNLLKDAIDARTQGAEGIGLYRSEFPFILKNDFLSEEQQYRIYRSIVLSHRGKPVDLRTADIGGDKLLEGRSEPEDNPFLGVRGIRFSLANKEMFGEQLRAILRAGAGEDLGIMLPMVSGVEEIQEARQEIERAKEQLSARNVAFHAAPRIGAMVELPAAALAARALAEETDFLSIGTNDLTMYLLAVDRTNEHLSHLYRTYHPTVLRTIERIVHDAEDAHTPVSVCGDAAADPLLARFFVGIGVTKLSVAPGNIEPTKQHLAEYRMKDARRTAGDMLSIGLIADMESYLAQQPVSRSITNSA